MIRKESSHGVGYSVVELNDVRHVFASAVPREGQTLEEQARDALKTVEAVVAEEGTQGSIVKQAVFLKDIDQVDECRRIMADYYGDELPATTYIPQPPCGGKLIEIEAMGVGRGLGEVEIERHSDRMVVTRHDGVDWVHLAHVHPETSAKSTYERSREIFQLADEGLRAKRFRFDQVVRTWLYLGDIVGLENDAPANGKPKDTTQRYMELNRARTDVYRDIHFGHGKTINGFGKPVYPASTGIGTEGKDVIMSCVALVTDRDDVKIVPLENPVQTAAFDYGTDYGLKSPKFCRAMAVSCEDQATIFISGTASITGAETRFIGDVEGQTHQTLDNIADLIGADNLREHGLPGMGATLAEMALARVYIKHQEDYEKTKAVCEARLGELPIIYAVGDVCRPDLLVEIEGIAFAQAIE